MKINKEIAGLDEIDMDVEDGQIDIDVRKIQYSNDCVETKSTSSSRKVDNLSSLVHVQNIWNDSIIRDARISQAILFTFGSIEMKNTDDEDINVSIEDSSELSVRVF